MTHAFEEGRRLGRRPETRQPLRDPAETLARAHLPRDKKADVYTEYEPIPGGWRCWLRVPMLAQAADLFGDNSRSIYGEGPTKQDARDVAIGWLQEQVRNGTHLSERLRAEDMMRRRRLS